MISKTAMTALLLAFTIAAGCAQAPQTGTQPATAAPATASAPASVEATIKKLLAENAARAGAAPAQCPSWTYPEMTGSVNNWVRAGCEKCAASEPMQSPVALNPATAVITPGGLPVNLSPRGYVVELVREFVDNNYAFKVTRSGAPLTIQWSGITFQLAEFHFHMPGEHVIVGQTLPVLEMHVKAIALVDGVATVAVFAIPFTVDSRGNSSMQLAPVARALRGGTGERFLIDEIMSPFLSNRTYFYMGGLTTPPCGGGNVIFLVMEKPIGVQAEVWNTFASTLVGLNTGLSNVRPLQNKGDSRVVNLLTR